MERSFSDFRGEATGKVRIEGPEEFPIERFLVLEKCNYLVVLAQRHDESGDVVLDLFFDSLEDSNSPCLSELSWS